MKTIKLSNLQVYFASKALEQLTLDVKQSSARRRFLRSIQPFVADLEAERDDTLQKFAEKDNEGKLKTDNNKYVFKAEARKQYNKVWSELNDIIITIEVNDSNRADLNAVAEIFQTEATRIETEKKNEFGADTFDYVELLKEVANSLKTND